MAPRSFLTSLLLSCALVSTGVDAIYIDSSCKQYQPWVGAAVQNAFDMANFGQASIQNVIKGTGSQTEKDLASNMFGSVDQAKYQDVADRFNAIRRQPFITPRNSLFDWKKSDDLDVILFCDFSRLVPLTDAQKKAWAAHIDSTSMYDTVLGKPITLKTSDLLGACKNGASFASLSGTPDAVTTAYQKDSSIMWSAIQLCPGYINAIAKEDKKTLNDIPDWKKWVSANSNMASRLKGFSSKLGLGKTPVDTVALLDSTILHEMTHAKAAVKYPTKDSPTVDLAGSGWGDTRGQASKASNTNAESLALYGLSLYLNLKGVIVQADGTVKPGSTTP